MRDYIEETDVANAVMMLRSGFKGTIVIVEGNTDDRLYGKFMDPDGTDIVIAQSKTNVERTLKELAKRGENKSLGIVDSDLDLVKGVKKRAPLFVTDTRDAESMMFFSSALESLLSEYADKESLHRFTERYGIFRDVICKSCYYVGLLMLISEREGLNLSFKNLDFSFFIDKRTLQCDIRKLVRSVLDGPIGSRIDPDMILKLLQDEKEHSFREMCRGHDITEVLAIGMREVFGSYNAKTVKSSAVAGGLRLAFSAEDLRATDLYSKSSQWASDNGIPLWRV